MPWILLSDNDDNTDNQVVYVDDEADTISFPQFIPSQIHSQFAYKKVTAAVSFIYQFPPSWLSRSGPPHGKAELFLATKEGDDTVLYVLDHYYHTINGRREFTPDEQTETKWTLGVGINFDIKNILVGPKQTIGFLEYRVFYCVAANNQTIYPMGYHEGPNGAHLLPLPSGTIQLNPNFAFHGAILASNFQLAGRNDQTIGDLVVVEGNNNTLHSFKAVAGEQLYPHQHTVNGDVAFCNGSSVDDQHQGALYVAISNAGNPGLHVYQFKASTEPSAGLALVAAYDYNCTNETVISMKAHPTTLFVLTNKSLWAIRLENHYTLSQNEKTHVPCDNGLTFQGFALGQDMNSKPLLRVVVGDGQAATELWTYSGDYQLLQRKRATWGDCGPYTLSLNAGSRIIATMDLKPLPVTHQLMMTDGTLAGFYFGMGKRFEDNLAMYTKDRRNIEAHIIGVLLIVLSIFVLLARAEVEWNGVMVPWLLLVVVAVLSTFYLLQNVRFALIMIALQIAYGLLAIGLATNLTTEEWLELSGTLFLVGCGFQFVGYDFEGRFPFDDLMGLPRGLMFIVAKFLYFSGLFPELPQITTSNH